MVNVDNGQRKHVNDQCKQYLNTCKYFTNYTCYSKTFYLSLEAFTNPDDFSILSKTQTRLNCTFIKSLVYSYFLEPFN